MLENRWLFAPWRMAYIKGETKPVSGCIFCQAVEQDDAQEHIVYRGQRVYVILNRYPYSSGHLMVIPYAHVPTQEALDVETLTELMLTVNRALAALRKVYQPPAFNLGANLGAAAGAGIAEHFHFHVVPRWPHDANFMTAIGDTRVIPSSLDETWQALREAWA